MTNYFTFTAEQQSRMEYVVQLYHEWNEKINLVSRKDIENIFEHHILHSLSIAKYISFTDNTNLLDVGTGGGFPGIPLAIYFPRCHWTLIDSIGKKIRVVEDIVRQLGLTNVRCICERVEAEKGKYDFVVSRATMSLTELYKVTRKNIRSEQHNAIPNGIITLKGGDISDEIKPFKHRVEVTAISDYFQEEYFSEKKIIYLPL